MAQTPQFDGGYIGDLVRGGDQDRYWSALLAPEPARSDLLALYAFHLELARIPDQVSEPQLGEIRLQWWRDALRAALEGGAADHPVLAALAQAASRHQLPASDLAAMIDAFSFDLGDELMPDFAVLEAYLAATSGAVFALGAHILGSGPAECGPLAAQAARAYGLAGVLRGLPHHASRGRVHLPADLLAAHGLHPDAVLQGGDNEDIRAACRDVRGRAWEAMQAFREEAVKLPRRLRPAFAPLALVQPYLKKLAAPDHHPLRDIVQLNPLARYGLIWRAYLSGRF